MFLLVIEVFYIIIYTPKCRLKILRTEIHSLSMCLKCCLSVCLKCSVNFQWVTVSLCFHTIVSGGLLPSVLRANQTPRLYVRLLNTSRNLKAALTLLPSTLVTCSLYVHTIGCFRQLVGGAFLRGRLGLALPSELNLNIKPFCGYNLVSLSLSFVPPPQIMSIKLH